MRDDLSCLHAVDGPRMHFNLLGSLSDDYDSVEISLSSYCWVRIFNDVHYCELLVLIVLGTAFCHLCFPQCKHFFHSWWFFLRCSLFSLPCLFLFQHRTIFLHCSFDLLILDRVKRLDVTQKFHEDVGWLLHVHLFEGGLGALVGANWHLKDVIECYARGYDGWLRCILFYVWLSSVLSVFRRIIRVALESNS